jgi:hypothetical protein
MEHEAREEWFCLTQGGRRALDLPARYEMRAIVKVPGAALCALSLVLSPFSFMGLTQIAVLRLSS